MYRMTKKNVKKRMGAQAHGPSWVAPHTSLPQLFYGSINKRYSGLFRADEYSNKDEISMLLLQKKR